MPDNLMVSRTTTAHVNALLRQVPAPGSTPREVIAAFMKYAPGELGSVLDGTHEWAKYAVALRERE